MTRSGYLKVALATLTLFILVHKYLGELGFFKPDERVEPAALLIAAVLVFFETIGGLVQERRGKQWHIRKKNARKAIFACLSTISSVEGLDVTQIGGSVFLVRRNPWYRPEIQLKRVVRYRLRDFPQQSDVRWLSGKGVIGRALEERRAVHENILAISERYGGAAISPEQYARLKPEVTSSFTLEEFRSIVGKYAEVLATPIWKNNQIIGVLSIDVPVGAEHPTPGTCLDSKAVKEVAATCAYTLAGIF